MEEVGKKEKRKGEEMSVIRIEKKKRAAVMPRAMKSEGTEGGSTGQPENTRGSDMKEDEGESWYVCQSG